MLFDDSAVVALQDVLAPLDPILRFASELGGSMVLVSLVVVTFWLCDRKTAIGIALVLLLSSLLNYGLKQAFAMPRPPETLHKVSESGYAMPSGHAQASGTFYTAASYQSGYEWAYLPAGAVIFLVSLSRVYLGVHYPADAVAGAVIGVSVGLAGIYAWSRLPDMDERSFRRGALLLAPILAAVLVVCYAFAGQLVVIVGVMLGLCVGYMLQRGASPAPARKLGQISGRVLAGCLFLVPLMAAILLLPDLSVVFAIALGFISTGPFPWLILKIEARSPKEGRK
jgi:membrane-associated phospholipid phosphatase